MPTTPLPAAIRQPCPTTDPASNPLPCRYGREQCVRMLLAAGADVGAKNDRGQTAAEVVRGEPRNPLNQDEALLMQLEGAL